ncbi:MAG: hypothetical protein VKI83_08725 [Synechococcaceae cyanobacterium]|nr:hypothetical protein [Synechococcaceae cyanobacterium]
MHGLITTLHEVANTQVMVAAFQSDGRWARSCSQSLIATTTGSGRAGLRPGTRGVRRSGRCGSSWCRRGPRSGWCPR